MPRHSRDKRTGRTPEQTDADRAFISSGLLRGETMSSIAERLTAMRPYRVTLSMVSFEAEYMRSEWRKQFMQDVSTATAIELAKLAELEKAYWEGYERSQKDLIKSVSEANESNSVSRRSPSHSMSEPFKSSRATVTKESRDGSVQWLAGVMSCVAQRCRILGIGVQSKAAEEDWMKSARKFGVQNPSEIFNDLVKQFVQATDGSAVGTEDDPGGEG